MLFRTCNNTLWYRFVIYASPFPHVGSVLPCLRLRPHHDAPVPVYRFCTAPCWLSRCIRATYCLDTVFHELMYFSMHAVKQPSSPLEREVPGLGTQRSKQCSFSFWGMLEREMQAGYLMCCTSTSMRAFCMAASCWTCAMMALFLYTT